MWDFESALDAATSFNGVAQLQPKVASNVNAKSLLAALVIDTTSQLDFKAVDIMKLEATIGDASKNKGLPGFSSRWPRRDLPAYCISVCPAGEDVLAPFLEDRGHFVSEVVKPFQQKEETIYVQPNSDADVWKPETSTRVRKCFP